MSYVAVPASALIGYLQSKHFSCTHCGKEVVYVRASVRNPYVLLKVYTSIPVNGRQVRQCGADAIRVVVAFESPSKSFGIWKGTRIFRVTSAESVLARLHERLTEAAIHANQWIDDYEFAQKEKADEEKGFASDPDYIAFCQALE